MAGEIELKGTLRIKSKTAAAWSAANPVLAADEPAYETDTGKVKIGDGATHWKALPYTIDPTVTSAQPQTPSLVWKVINGRLCIKPNAAVNDLSLQDCYVGILRYKNARKRTLKPGEYRPPTKGYKVVQDNNTRPQEVPWTKVRITPIKVDVTVLHENNGWMPVIEIKDLFDRFVETLTDPKSAGNQGYYIHRGQNIARNTFGPGYDGKIRQKATVYSGVVLFRFCPTNKNIRYEGPRSYFKICNSNYEPIIKIVPMA